MTVTKKDIFSIKAGESVTFQLDSYEEAKALQSRLSRYRLSSFKPASISKYSSVYNSDTIRLTVTAIPS